MELGEPPAADDGDCHAKARSHGSVSIGFIGAVCSARSHFDVCA